MISAEKTALKTFTIENVSRRSFLEGMLSASAFVLCATKSSFLAKAAGKLVPAGAVPSVDGVIYYPPKVPQTVVGARGPLSPAESKAVIERLGAQSDLLQRHLAIEQEVAGAPLSVGNRTRLLQDGPETFKAMFAAIKAARRNIYLEYYIFEDVESDHVHLVDLLAAKARAGVSVAVIYDSYG